MDVMVGGIKVGEEIMAQPAIRKLIRAAYRPDKPLRTTADYEEYVKRNTQGALHYSGACKMGTDEMSVVDPQLRVHGIDGLRVADSSIMPNVISGNLNAPTIMIGERAADFIRGNR